MKNLSSDEIKDLVKRAAKSGDKDLIYKVQLLQSPLYTFRPRPDKPELFDEQTAYCDDTASRVQVVLKGTGAGGSTCSAFKVAKFLLFERPAPRRDTPFWIVSETYDLSCGVCWGEKLSEFIPQSAIQDVAWLNQKLGHPQAVVLKPWQGKKTNWRLEFKSAAQGRHRLQAASIGGAWISEPLSDWSVFVEIDGRCRDYSWARVLWDQTPLIPQPELEERFENPPPGWAFFRMNTEQALASGHVQREWYDSFYGSMPEDVKETRRVGAFGNYEGVIFKEFDARQHIVKPFDIPDGWLKYRSLDFGNHVACVFMALDPETRRWYVFREYYWDFDKRGGRLIKHHANVIGHVFPWNRPNCLATWGDPADPTSIREFGQHGIHCTGANKNTLGSIEFVRKLLLPQADGRPGLLFFRPCVESIRQVQAYRWKRGSAKADPKPEPVKHYDHLVDCIRYLLYSRQMGTRPAGVFRPLNIKKPDRGLVRGWRP